MTVGLAALARRGMAIVIMADRRLTYASDDLHTESWKPKLIPVSEGWHVLFSGEPTLAEGVVGRARSNAEPISTVAKLGRALQFYYETEMDRRVFMPRRLTRDLYLARKSDMLELPDRYRQEVDNEIANLPFDCTLLACGHEDGRAGILTLHPYQMVNAWEGFAVIGSGQSAARAAMVFGEVNPEDDVDVQLYQLLYAKTHAEMTSYVGYDLDAWILTPEKGLVKVDGDIVGHEEALLDRVLEDATKLPFKTRPEWKKPGWKAPRSAPRGWEKKLKDYVQSVAGEWKPT